MAVLMKYHYTLDNKTDCIISKCIGITIYPIKYMMVNKNSNITCVKTVVKIVDVPLFYQTKASICPFLGGCTMTCKFLVMLSDCTVILMRLDELFYHSNTVSMIF